MSIQKRTLTYGLKIMLKTFDLCVESGISFKLMDQAVYIFTEVDISKFSIVGCPSEV